MSRAAVCSDTLPGQIPDDSALKKVLVNLLDVDGCLFHSFPIGEDRKFTGAPIEDWIFSTNQKFLQFLSEQIQENKYQRVIFGLGTNRQDFHLDRKNGVETGGGSCIPLLPLMQSHFQDSFRSIKVVLDPFMMADVFAKKSYKHVIQSGAAFTDILFTTRSESRAKFDEFKVSLIYAHAHRAALLNPDTEITLNFFDDRSDILQTLRDFFFGA